MIASIAIYPVDRMPRCRLRPHVRIEGFKTINPLIANADSTTSIERIVLPVFVAAPAAHILPRLILRQVVAAAACAVFEGPLADLLLSPTPAGFGAAVDQ